MDSRSPPSEVVESTSGLVELTSGLAESTSGLLESTHGLYECELTISGELSRLPEALSKTGSAFIYLHDACEIERRTYW